MTIKTKEWFLLLGSKRGYFPPIKLTIVLLMLAAFTFAGVSAVPPADLQQKTVTGVILDNVGQPLAAASVIEKGTTNGQLAGADGSYSIRVASDNTVLVFSFIGYTSQEITVGAQTVINVTLLPIMSELDEVVVVGYSTQVRRNVSGSVSSVTSNQLTVSTAPTAISRIQGQASGVTVTVANRPGGDATIRVRGIGTINDSEPLYIIDGIPASPGNNLNPNDIESMTILKDASSSAIYGTRGANGVVIITTKRGKSNQKPTVELSVRTGITQASTHYDLLNTSEYAEAVWLARANNGTTAAHAQYGAGSSPVIPDYILPNGAMEGDPAVNPDLYKFPDYQIFKANKEGTDWFKEMTRNGIVREYDISVRGGGQDASYAFSGNYLDEDGYFIHTNFKRYTFRLNSDAKVTDWLRFGETLQGIFINELGRFTDNAEDSPISYTYRTQPIVPVYDISGVNFAGSKASEMGNSENGVASLYRARNNNGKWTRALGSFYAELTPIKGLAIKSLMGYNYGQWNYRGFTIPNFEHSEPNRVNGHNVSTNNSLQWNFTNTAIYNFSVADDHKFNVLVGTEAIENKYEEANASRSQYFSEDPDYMWLNSGELNRENNGYGSEWALFSVFGRLNYDYMGKYLAEATFRRDGSSRFSAANRYGNFPAFSLGWGLSEESFMAGTKSWLDYLKLRLGLGFSGNDKIGNYNSYSTYASDKYQAGYAIDGSNTSATSGFYPANLGNEDVTWETTRTIDGGLDALFLNSRLSLTLDVWRRDTKDMLYNPRIPNVLGRAAPPFINIGEMKNTGFDLDLGYKSEAMGGKLLYSAKLTLSHYKNEITKLSDDVNEFVPTGGLRQVDYSRFQVGTAFPEFYGYEVEGIFQTPAEAAAHPPYEDTDYNQAGHYKYKNQLTIDSDGDGVMDQADNIINSADMVYIGNPHPDLTGGLNLDLAYGGFDLNVFFYGSYGNDIINVVRRWIDYGQFNANLSKDALYKTWGSPYLDSNADATLPMLDQNDKSQIANSALVEDGSFLRLKNVRLGYTLPTPLLSRFQVKNVRLYAQVTNLFTLTKYSGLDPELNSSGSYMGLDQGAWPTPRQFMFGLTIGL